MDTQIALLFLVRRGNHAGLTNALQHAHVQTAATVGRAAPLRLAISRHELRCALALLRVSAVRAIARNSGHLHEALEMAIHVCDAAFVTEAVQWPEVAADGDMLSLLVTSMYAQNGRIVRALLGLPGVRAIAAADHNAPLRAAVTTGRLDLVELLLEIPAVTEAAGALGNEALTSAANAGFTAVVERLLVEPAVSTVLAQQAALRGGPGGAPWHTLIATARNGHTDTMRVLLNNIHVSAALTQIETAMIALRGAARAPAWRAHDMLTLLIAEPHVARHVRDRPGEVFPQLLTAASEIRNPALTAWLLQQQSDEWWVEEDRARPAIETSCLYDAVEVLDILLRTPAGQIALEATPMCFLWWSMWGNCMHTAQRLVVEHPVFVMLEADVMHIPYVHIATITSRQLGILHRLYATERGRRAVRHRAVLIRATVVVQMWRWWVTRRLSAHPPASARARWLG